MSREQGLWMCGCCARVPATLGGGRSHSHRVFPYVQVLPPCVVITAPSARHALVLKPFLAAPAFAGSGWLGVSAHIEIRKRERLIPRETPDAGRRSEHLRSITPCPPYTQSTDISTTSTCLLLRRTAAHADHAGRSYSATRLPSEINW